jgi:hypothetical protein
VTNWCLGSGVGPYVWTPSGWIQSHRVAVGKWSLKRLGSRAISGLWKGWSIWRSRPWILRCICVREVLWLTASGARKRYLRIELLQSSLHWLVSEVLGLDVQCKGSTCERQVPSSWVVQTTRSPACSAFDRRRALSRLRKLRSLMICRAQQLQYWSMLHIWSFQTSWLQDLLNQYRNRSKHLSSFPQSCWCAGAHVKLTWCEEWMASDDLYLDSVLMVH